MSIPVIALNDEQVTEVRALREHIRSLKERIDELEKAKRGTQKRLDNLLHEVAIQNDDRYRQWWEKRQSSLHGHDPYDRYDVNLSDDGTMVVLVRRQS